MSDSSVLDANGPMRLVQRLPTSAARSVSVCADSDGVLLAVSQFAKDIPGRTPSMHGGDSNVNAPLYRWQNAEFVECGSVPLAGGEHVEFFDIAGRSFLAAASIRSGSGPYEMNVRSRIHEWKGGQAVECQAFDTFGAKQWKHFSIADRHFLALAQGVENPGISTTYQRTSRIYEWQSGKFLEFQVLAGRWGYGWCPMQLGGNFLLAYADHLERSLIYRWDGTQFATLQSLEGGGGRAFATFERDGAHWLVFANIQRGVELLRWDGNRFTPHAAYGAPGARAVRVVTTANGLFLFVANFIQGTPAAPRVLVASDFYVWGDGGFELCGTFASSGAVDLATFEAGSLTYVVVANSLNPDLTFRTDTLVYEFSG